jgi:hypothetical protein
MAPTNWPSWLLFASLDLVQKKLDAGARFGVGGVCVIAPEAPGGLNLELRAGGQTLPVKWGIPSPWIRGRYPHVPQAANSRFRSDMLVLDDPAHPPRIVLCWRGGEALIGTAQAAPPKPPLVDLAPPAELLPAVRDAIATQQMTPEAAARFLGQLGEKEGSSRNPTALKVAILCRAAVRAEAKKAFALLEQLGAELKRAGAGDELTAFHAELLAVLHPRTLTPHGYGKALAAAAPLSECRPLATFIRVVEAVGYPWFVNSGTLLGLVREGGLIAHDDDIDLAVVFKAQDPYAMEAERQTLFDELARQGCAMTRIGQSRLCHHKLADARFVDVFPAWVDADGRVFVWPHTFGELARDDLFPLRRVPLQGLELPLPRNAEAMLELNYGPGWRRPDPAWRFDWRAASKKFRPRFPE